MSSLSTGSCAGFTRTPDGPPCGAGEPSGCPPQALEPILTAAGKRYHNQYHDLLIVRDGKIHAGREYLDTAHAQDVIVTAALAAG
jgi:hypothetical protein